MYYEKEILALDNDGNFLLAVHFPLYAIGGECSRESEHAYFAYGNINTPGDLNDITPLCCIKREPSHIESERLLHTSEVQKNIVGNEKTAWKYAYQAELSTKEAQFVPRKVLTSRNAILVIGIECSGQAGTPFAVQRVIDVFNRSILQEHKETQWPKGKSLAYPQAISNDGESIISADVSRPDKPCFNQHRLGDQKILANYPEVSAMAQFIYIRGDWIIVDEDSIYIPSLGTDTNKLKTPIKIFSWTAKSAIDGDIIAFSGEKGLIIILNIATAKTKTYFPHRGCKRDDRAQVELSANGQWMASKLCNNRELVLTRLGDGTSWKIADVENQVLVERKENSYVSESFIPAAFVFIGSRLLVSENNGVRELSTNEPEAVGEVFISEQGKPGARVPLKITAKASLNKIIKEAGLKRHAQQITDFYYPAIKIKTKKTKKSGWYMPDKRGAPGLGGSRLGGWPDLPQGMAWPTWNKRPMGFLGQINLAEVSTIQPLIRLPKEGLLMFFLGCNDEIYENDYLNQPTYMLDIMLGSNPEQRDGWKVIYVEPGKALTRTVYNGDIAPDLFQPSLVKIAKGGMPLPHEITAAYDCLDLERSERDNFNEVLDLISEENPEHQMSGYPHLIQSIPAEFYCALADSGKDPYTFFQDDSPEFKQLEENASKWGLLLQLTSDDNPNFLWGDAGHLYFYGNRKEMEQGQFENTWVYYEN